MNKIKLLLLLLVVGLLFSSCYKEEDWLADNSTTEEKFFPVVQNVFSSVDSMKSGDTSIISVKYWSHDEIKEIELWANEGGEDRKVSTWSYVDSFDDEAHAEVTNLDYIAPSFSDTTVVTIKAIVNNVNGLSKFRTVSLVVLP